MSRVSPDPSAPPPARPGRPTPCVTAHITTIDMTAWCFLRSWFAALVEDGHEVHLLTTRGPFTQRLKDLGVTVHDVPIARRIDPVRDLISLWRLYRALRRIRPAIVHTHTSKAGFLGRLAARLASVPHVLHTMHEPPHNAAGGPLTRILYIWIERLAAHLADRIVTVSYANEKEIERQRLVDRKHLTVIREGLDLARYPRATDPRAAVRALGIADDVLVVGTVGRLEQAKGHEWLLKSAPAVLAQVPNVHFIIIGGGPFAAPLSAMATELGISDHVTLTGYREDMLALLQGFDLFVLPSLWEGLGIVLLEAMAYEKAIVASRVGGVTDVVVEEQTGILIPPRDPRALSKSIVRMLRDPSRREEMGRAGYERLTRVFRDDLANERMMTLYQRILESPPSTPQP